MVDKVTKAPNGKGISSSLKEERTQSDPEKIPQGNDNTQQSVGIAGEKSGSSGMLTLRKDDVGPGGVSPSQDTLDLEKKYSRIQNFYDTDMKEPLLKDIDKQIERHLKFKPRKDTVVYYYLEEINFILGRMNDIFKGYNTLLEIEAPVIICGDVHGQMNDLLLIFKRFGTPEKRNYLFLGDYIDRGNNSLEVINLLFLFKLKYPNMLHLLRGNHELQHINKVYGFYEELSDRFQEPELVEDIYSKYNEIFKYMPLAACVSKRILCMHGGISENIETLNTIRNIKRPLTTVDGAACDLLWADPDDEIKMTTYNDARGVSVKFGEDFLEKFCNKLNLDMVIRGHQVCKIGFAVFKKGRLITVFSASDYDEEMRNLAGVIHVSNTFSVRPVSIKCPKVEREKKRKLKIQNNEITRDNITAPLNTK
uniref:Serine/threonine-protein phosphatase n=1 Tax=Parastrongyloides trichosuri TaxID=131310 RepID=A0A0N4Z2N7_PARTI